MDGTEGVDGVDPAEPAEEADLPPAYQEVLDAEKASAANSTTILVEDDKARHKELEAKGVEVSRL